MNLNEKLNHIRSIVDTELCEDVESALGLASQISSVIGLSAECKASAKKKLELARLRAMQELRGEDYPPSIMSKAIDAHCSDELAVYEYADRLNAAITHQLDIIRTIISYRKEEMANERVNHFAP